MKAVEVPEQTNFWKPTDKQSEFLQLPYTVLEGFYAGAVGAGKSDVLLLYPIIHRFHENGDFKGLFLRRTFPELKNEIIPRSRKFYKALDGEYNKNDKIWEFPSGALIFFGHVENEDDVHNYDSMQPNYVAFDELTSFTEWQYLYITLERVRSKLGSKLPAIVRSASNPGNIGHNWVRKRFIDPCPEGFSLIESPSGIKRIFIPATIDDNPHIDPAYRKSLEALPQAEKQAKLYGDWSAYEGQVFEEFRDKLYPDEPDEALHVLGEVCERCEEQPCRHVIIDIPDWWPRINITDWGYSALTYSLFGAISPRKRLYIYKELFWKRAKIEEWGAILKEQLDREPPQIVKVCKSASQDQGVEHTVREQIETALGRPVELTTNTPGSRIATKILVHEYLRWRQKYSPSFEAGKFDEEKAQYIYRNRGITEYQQYCESFKKPEPETNLPKVQIFNCPLLVNTIKTCQYAKNTTDGKPVEDVAEFGGDDPYDTFRYMVDTADRYFESATTVEKMMRQQIILDNLQKTGDFTAFYRNSAALDSSKQSLGVARYSHRRR